MTTRFGLKLTPQYTTIDDLRAVWQIADEAGFDWNPTSAWWNETVHFIQDHNLG